MLTQRRLIPLPDGREIDVLTTGPEDGFPLVVHGGTPSGLVVDSKIAAAATDRGLRFVLTARPGYEGSTPRPGRRVRDVAADVAGVLDALGAGEFVSIGMSGGGPHSLACAALLPGRCLAAASVAGVGPYLAEGWTSWPGWDRKTSPSSAWRCAARRRSPRTWRRRRWPCARSPGSRSPPRLAA